MFTNIKKELLDKMGMTASLACAIHCALMPVVLSYAALSGLHFLLNPWIEGSIVALSFSIAASSLIPAWYRRHRKLSPFLLMVLGFCAIAGGHLFFHEAEAISSTTGALFIALAHWRNIKLMRQHPHHCDLPESETPNS